MSEQELYQPSPVLQQTVGGWHQEFMTHQIQKPPELSQQDTSMAFGALGINNFGSINSYPLAGLTPMSEMYHQPTLFQGDQFDDAAFERAFAAASSDILESEAAGEQLQNSELLMEEPLEHQAASRIGADAIPEEMQREGQEAHEDEDALARTAGQLLNSVRDNQSQKFQESNFLALMRQLRDREVRVEGDKIVGTDSQKVESQKNAEVDIPLYA